MAQTLDMPFAQVLVFYPEDPGGMVWHHRVLMKRVAAGEWITLTPDYEFQRHNLREQRHIVLGRRSGFPDHAEDSAYVFDQVGHAVLAGYKRRATIQASILAGVDDDGADIERLVWVIAEVASNNFGEIVSDEVMDDPETGLVFDSKGVARVAGEERLVERISESSLDQWREERAGCSGDARLLDLPSAVALMRDKREDDFPMTGEMDTLEYLKAIADGPGNLVSYHAEWVRLSGSDCRESRMRRP